MDSKFDDKFFTMTDQGVLTSLAKIVKHRGIEFVVIDTLAQAVDLMDENNNAEMQRKVVRPFNQFAQASNAAVMWIHHMGKNNGEQGDAMFKSRGASSKSAGVRLQMNLEPASKDDNTFIMLQCAKLKGYEKFPDTKFYYDRDRRWFVDPQVAQVKQVTLEEKLYDFLNQGMPMNGVQIKAEFSSISPATIYRTLTRLELAGKVEIPKYGQYIAVAGFDGHDGAP